MRVGLTRLLLLLLAGVLGALAFVADARRPDGVPPPRWLAQWERDHPDPRELAAPDADVFSGMEDGERREDLTLLLAALAAGCAAAGWSTRLVARAGSAAAAVLVAGSVAVGVFAVAISAKEQWSGLRAGTWTLSDDNLDVVAGPQAATLRAWRRQIGPQDAVIVVGTDQPLLNVVAWALFPRPLFPRLQDLPPDLDEQAVRKAAAGLDIGRGRPARWIVDLRVLRSGGAGSHPALMQVDA